MSSNPQPVAVYVQITNERVHQTSCHSDNTVNVDLDRNGVPVGVEVIGALSVTMDGEVCRCAPTPSAAPTQTDEDLIDIVAEALRERPFHFGPNTRDSIVRGMDKVYLTGAERQDLACMALDALRQVSAGE